MRPCCQRSAAKAAHIYFRFQCQLPSESDCEEQSKTVSAGGDTVRTAGGNEVNRDKEALRVQSFLFAGFG